MVSSIASGLAAFRQVDADRSGAVSVQELSKNKALGGSALTSAINGQGGGTAGAQRVFESFDKDGNGKLTGREFADGLVNLTRDSAAAVLAAQEVQNPAARLAGVLKGGLYASFGSGAGLSASANAGSFAQNVLAAYFRR